jgi:aminoglycoside 6'-N-acetyltransferase I
MLADAAGLLVDVYSNPPWNFAWMNVENTRRFFRDAFATPGFRGYAMIVGGKLAGVCAGQFVDYFSSPTFEIREICVSRPLQRRGRGKAFLEYIEGKAKNDGAAAVTLLTQDNIGAYQFYKKNGYAESASSVHMHKILV